jgi:hypothetical protein
MNPQSAIRNPQSFLILIVLLGAITIPWRWICGPTVPGAHQHGLVNHVWTKDGWTGAIWTHPVNYRTFLAVKSRRLNWLCGPAVYGKQ